MFTALQSTVTQSQSFIGDLQSQLQQWEQRGAEMQKKVESSQAESLQLKSQFESAVNLKERKLQDREAQLANVNHQVCNKTALCTHHMCTI